MPEPSRSAGPRVAVVGGGAAGIFAALSAAEGGARVVIFERNDRIGIKILISGGGKCNITHRAAPAEVEAGFIRGEARFLRYALHELTAEDLISALEAEGVETYTRPNGRVFPVSGRADDVLSAFERMLARSGVEIRTGCRVGEIVVEEGRAVGVRPEGEENALRFDAVIVTTGGISYRKVGTTGDGIRWAERLGHTIVPLRAALAPIYFAPPPHPRLQGVALRDISLSVDPGPVAPGRARRGIYPETWRDDLLFTHRGVSGPAVLEVSRSAALSLESGAEVRLLVDILPDLSMEELTEAWNRRTAESPKGEVQTFLEGYMPRGVIPFLLESAGVPDGTKTARTTREERARLLATMKGWALGPVGEVPIDRGEVTAGGVALSEVSPVTMESKRVPALYFAGEALDIAGSVGGYNLQAAFATGRVAGRAAAGRETSGRGPEASSGDSSNSATSKTPQPS